MSIFIDEFTGKRVNIYAPYKDYSRLSTPEIRAAANVIEIEDDPAPADYSDETYYRTEDWETVRRPYVIYTQKSPEQLELLQDNKNLQAAKQHLADTDYLFNVDRHSILLTQEPERAVELATSREAAREVIRQYGIKYPPVVEPTLEVLP